MVTEGKNISTKNFFWALAEQAKRCRKSAPVDGTPVLDCGTWDMVIVSR
jgi:hypothetical protein